MCFKQALNPMPPPVCYILALLLLLELICIKEATRLHIDEFLPPVNHSYIVNSDLDRFSTTNINDNEWLKAMNIGMTLSLSPLSIAVNFAHVFFQGDFVIKNEYTTKHNGIAHVYFRQMYRQLEIVNADANINVNKEGKIVSFSESFFKKFEHGRDHDDDPSVSIIGPIEALELLLRHIDVHTDHLLHLTSFIDSQESVTIVESFFSSPTLKTFIRVPISKSLVSVELAYIQINNGKALRKIWNIVIDLEENWFNAFVSAHPSEGILGIVDWVSDSAYLIYPNAPDTSEPEIRFGPLNYEASPLGWHRQDIDLNFRTTMGNNVFAQENLEGGVDWEDNQRPYGGSDHEFVYKYDHTKDPKASMNASITNLFYWNNWMHDIFAAYGFDEAAGNFQENNFNRGGKESDGIVANAQDGSGINNANFATPPDGQKGRMRMYLWSQFEPYRDGDLDKSIIIHEYSHGITTRLTGGAANSNCLHTDESGGLGEGWGDFFAIMFKIHKDHHRYDEFQMGVYVNGKGIRYYPYSSDMKKNPSTYGDIRKYEYTGVHAKGEIWAMMLLEAYWNIVEEKGFDPNWLSGVGGNNIFLRVVVDALKLQPCRPSFINARDAILLADHINYKGRHACMLWKGFAKRGLGFHARTKGHESFALPEACLEE